MKGYELYAKYIDLKHDFDLKYNIWYKTSKLTDFRVMKRALWKFQQFKNTEFIKKK